MAISEICKSGDKPEEFWTDIQSHVTELITRRVELSLKYKIPILGIKIYEQKADPSSCLNLAPEARKKCGFIYFLRAGDVVKIGWALDPNSRMKTIAAMSPIPVNLICVKPGSLSDEKLLHEKFAALKAHGEWFSYASEVKEYITKCKGGD